MDSLYLKLDNKLQLRIKEVTITPSDETGVINADHIIEGIKNFPLLFSKVDIQKLSVLQHGDRYDFRIGYENETYSIDAPWFFLYSTIDVQKHIIHAEPIIHVKNQNAYIFGNLHYDIFKDDAAFESTFYWHDAKGDLSITKEQSILKAYAKSESFQNLKAIFDSFGLNRTINAWTYEKITSPSYKLAYMRFTHDLTKPLNLYNLDAKAVAQDTAIKFHEKVDAVQTQSVDVHFTQGQLRFTLHEPTYRGHSIAGSKVYISDLLDDKSDFIVVDIKANQRYDRGIKAILDAYGIDILLTQPKGTIKADLRLKIFFKDGATTATGTFKAQNALFNLFGYDLPAKHADVLLNGSRLQLQNIRIEDAEQNFAFSGDIDFDDKDARLVFDIDSYEKFDASVKDERLRVGIDFNGATQIRIPKLDTQILVDNKLQIKFNDLARYVPYFPAYDYNISGGSAVVSSQDYKRFDLHGKLKTDNRYLYRNNYLESYPFDALYDSTKGQLLVNIDDGVHYNHKKRLLSLHGINIDVTEFLQEGKNIDGKIELSARGENSDIKIDTSELVSDSYELLLKNGYIYLNARKGASKTTFSLYDGVVSMTGSNLDDTVLHPLINFKGLKSGTYHYELSGSRENLAGRFAIEGGIVQNVGAYNNLLALINTIPALAVFKDPGFNADGLVVREGEINFVVKGDYLIITDLLIKGKSSDLLGSGVIDLVNDRIDMNVKIKTVREVGELVSKIPVAGYIIFGDDKSLSFKAKIKGDLKDPEVSTDSAEKIFKSPLQMIKRTIESPLKLLEDIF